MNADTTTHPPVRADGLTRRFRRTLALDDVTLEVARGRVFGLVGENGAGKTTFIKHLLGLLKPDQGQVRVFGMDPVQDPEHVLARIGYLSEDHDLPAWMRVGELLRYTQAFYPRWDEAYAEELRKTFGLDANAKIRHLSRGQRAQAGLLCALAHRPPLLLLDEPSSGLDAVVRRDILGAIVRTVADEGRTVFFSSHLIDEVERVADVVAMISRGKLVLCGPVDEIREQHQSLVLRFDTPQARPPTLDGVLSTEGGGHEWTIVCDGRHEKVRASASALGATIVEERTPTLEDIFVARVGMSRRELQEA
jgi:ABC-type multidrug transport system ATPase subunit